MAPLNVLDFLHKSIIPKLPFHKDDFDYAEACMWRQNGLSIAPASYRRLETMLHGDAQILEAMRRCESRASRCSYPNLID